MSQDRLIWAEPCEERREKKSLRHKLSTARRHHQSSHISDLLPRCASQLSSPIIKITPPVIILVKSYLKHVHQLLPVAAEAQVELPFCGFFSFSLYQFTASWVERFLLGWSLKVLVCFSEWFFSAAAGSLISDKSSNLCKLKPCQMELKGLSVCQI